MENTMKNASRRSFPAVIGLAALLLVPCAFAQDVQVEVPFQFVAGDRVLPPGIYRVHVDAQTDRLQIARENGGFTAYALAHHVSRPGGPARGALTFHRYGDSWVLRNVAAAGYPQVWELRVSRLERELARNARAEIAVVRPR
jgi:hypothetical protein